MKFVDRDGREPDDPWSKKFAELLGITPKQLITASGEERAEYAKRQQFTTDAANKVSQTADAYMSLLPGGSAASSMIKRNNLATAFFGAFDFFGGEAIARGYEVYRKRSCPRTW